MEKETQPVASNQTNFSQEAAFYDQAPFLSDDSVKPSQSKIKNRIKNKRLIIIVSVIGLVVLLLGWLLLSVPQRSSTPQDELQPEGLNISSELTPIQERIQEARLDLENADPVQEITPFPPINSEIRF